MKNRTGWSRLFLGATAGTLILFFAGPGCNIVAPAYYVLHGPEKTPAMFELDDTRVTVIFVDDRLNRAPRRSLRVAAAQQAEQTLMDNSALPSEKLITTRAIMRLASQEQFTEPKTIAELGRSIGADVVIYATIDFWSLSPDGVTFQPGAQVRVKVIDAENDARIWPTNGPGQPVTASLPPQTEGMPTGAERDQANLALAAELGVKLARLFFAHEKDTLSGKLGD